MKETRKLSEQVRLIAEELIEKDPCFEYLKGSDVSIIYLVSDATPTKNGMVTMGVCELVPDKYKWAIPADFTITLYVQNIEAAELDEEQIMILVKHELMHIGYDKGRCHVVPHNVQDFYSIIKEYGVEWGMPKGKA